MEIEASRNSLDCSRYRFAAMVADDSHVVLLLVANGEDAAHAKTLVVEHPAYVAIGAWSQIDFEVEGLPRRHGHLAAERIDAERVIEIVCKGKG